MCHRAIQMKFVMKQLPNYTTLKSIEIVPQKDAKIEDELDFCSVCYGD